MSSDLLSFEGRCALVTGAGRGIGRAFALELARRGARVCVNDLGCAIDGVGADRSPAEEVCAEIEAEGGVAHAEHGDVVAGAEEIVAASVEAFGALDVVVNCAGVLDWELFGQMSADRFRRVLSVHLDGTVNVLRAAWPHLARSRSGRVVNICSSATLGMPKGAPYSTGKAAIIGLTRTLALEGSQRGINVNAIMPLGATRMSGTMPEPGATLFARTFRPEAIAPLVLWLAHEATTVSGEIFTVGGGRAARVLLGIGAEVIPGENTPEAWAAAAEDLLSDELTAIPADGFAEAMLAMAALGGSALLESPDTAEVNQL